MDNLKWLDISKAPNDKIVVLLDNAKKTVTCGYMVKSCNNYVIQWQCAATGKLVNATHFAHIPQYLPSQLFPRDAKAGA